MKNEIKIKKPKIIPFLITLGITLILIIIAIILVKSNANNKQLKIYNYNDLIASSKDEKDMYVKFSINYEPLLFAENDDDKYYLVFAIYEDYTAPFIVKMPEYKYDGIMAAYNLDKEKFVYTFEGYLRTTSDELRNFAIDSLNDIYEDKAVNKDNYQKYIGKTYLDTSYSPGNATITIAIALAALSSIATVIIFVFYIVYKHNFKKLISKYSVDELEREINKDSTYNINKFYITEKFILSLSSYSVMEKEDIIWAYPKNQYVNGVPTASYLILGKKDGQLISFLTSNEATIQSVIAVLKENNKKMLVGYSKENQIQFKNYKKSLKGKK